ncbi:MAG TPA: cytochrome c3 family protein, partial [Gemmatimonadales bacterium]|nr:cytochrome c3 family protein [Gemmatimonadales bacterium]
MAERRLPVALVALLLLAAGPARAQLSPGPLARPHAALEGTLKCTQCHAGRRDAMARACLGCHREIAALAERERGLHTRERVAECASCHPDHAGRDFAMVSWPEGAPERFDHRRAGWALEQAHARAKCTDC